MLFINLKIKIVYDLGYIDLFVFKGKLKLYDRRLELIFGFFGRIGIFFVLK